MNLSPGIPIDVLRGSAAYWRAEAAKCEAADYAYGVERANGNAVELKAKAEARCKAAGVNGHVAFGKRLAKIVRHHLSDLTAGGSIRKKDWEAALTAANVFTKWSETARREPPVGSLLAIDPYNDPPRELFEVVGATKKSLLVSRYVRSLHYGGPGLAKTVVRLDRKTWSVCPAWEVS